MKRVLSKLVSERWLALSIWGRIFVLLLLAHLIVGAIRFPRNVQKKRAEIAEYQELGRVAWPFRNDAPAKTEAPAKAEAIQLLLDTTGPRGVVFYEGQQKGDLEFAAALLYPRLLIPFSTKRPQWLTQYDRFIARIPDADLFPILVLPGGPSSLELIWR